MTVTPFRRKKDGWPVIGQDEKPVHKSQENMAFFLKETECQVYCDAFAARLMIEWRGKHRPLDDEALLALYFAADHMGLRPNKAWFVDCIMHMAYSAPRDAVRDRLDAIAWDGTQRLDGWLVRHGHGRDTQYDRAVFTCTFIAMARRIRHPGTKFDQIVVLEGPQGCGKSTFLRTLARDDALFTDALPIGAKDKEALEITSGKLIVELGELAGIGKRDLATVKLFASRQSDRARGAYMRFATEVPRRFVCWGTTNDNQYLDDPTGNRRFWPLTVGQIDLKQARADVDQLWAEAAHLEAQGASIVLPQDLWRDAATVQAERLIGDTWEDVIADKLDLYRHRAVKVRTGDVLLSIGIAIDRQDRPTQMRVAKIMKRLGFDEHRMGKHRTRGWISQDATSASLIECNTLSGGFNLKGDAGHE